VGDSDYLNRQFASHSSGSDSFPTILPLPKKFHFGKLDIQLFRMWEILEQKTGVVFDLLYDTVGWVALLDYMASHPDAQVIYVHQGGLLGNESMLLRYQRFLARREINRHQF